MKHRIRIHAIKWIFGAIAAAWLAAAHGAMAEDVARAADEAKPQAAAIAAKPTNPLDAHRATRCGIYVGEPRDERPCESGGGAARCSDRRTTKMRRRELSRIH